MVADKISIENLPSYEIGFEKGIEFGKEKWLNVGKEEGRSEGIKLGEQRGIKLGLQKGRLEEKKAIALSLLDILDEKTIAKKVGLSVEEIRKLKEQN